MSLNHTLMEVALERQRQDKKWGQQDHPCIHQDLQYGVQSADTARRVCDTRHREGSGTWTDIAVEELAEVVDAPSDAERREELVQLAAVCVAWIQSIDRRTT